MKKKKEVIKKSEEIVSLYKDKLMNVKKIGILFGCSPGVIYKILKSNDLVMDNNERKNKLIKAGKINYLKRRDLWEKKNEIIKMYLLDNFSGEKIAKKFCCGTNTIFRILKKNKVKLKPNGFQIGHMVTQETKDMINNKKKGVPRKKQFNEQKMFDMYTYEKKSGTEIAKSLGCSHSIIYKRLKEKGIKLRGFINHTEEAKRKISAIQQGIPLEEWDGFAKSEPYGMEFNLQLKNKIRKRDNQVCMLCGIHREKLREAFHVHHINYDKKCNMPQNFISLCRKCHRFTNGNREHWTNLFQEKLSKLYGYQYSPEGEIILSLNKLNGCLKNEKTR